jgi:hypothetical protein
MQKKNKIQKSITLNIKPFLYHKFYLIKETIFNINNIHFFLNFFL